MRRRSLLSAMAAGSLALAGCTATSPDAATNASPSEPPQAGSPTSQDEELPEDCPTTQDLGVRWPRNLDESAVAGFVESYEVEYFKAEMDLLPEPGSRLTEYHGWIDRIKSVTPVADGGWRVHFSGIVGVRQGGITLTASVRDAPEHADIIPAKRIDDAAQRLEINAERITTLLDKGEATGEATDSIDPANTDKYLNLFALVSEDFEISRDGHSAVGILYFDVDGTTIQLLVSSLSGDYDWDAWYYVDEHVVWRSGERDVDPRDGELLECRALTETSS